MLKFSRLHKLITNRTELIIPGSRPNGFRVVITSLLCKILSSSLTCAHFGLRNN
ncbi:unnamed protein product [Moneuplotes crassus]|uniref:Uncharacterized protein n=1 Tax=Euplotes crassus TaxID=5936 RepID=A0AAD1Y3K7_EUPCR|nr:unnamed protein product [Moneuplotes crassus]